MKNLNNLPPFYIGQKVICIDDTPSLGTRENGHLEVYPVKNKIYTVRTIDNTPMGYAIRIKEIVNPILWYRSNTLKTELAFLTKRFAPLQESPFPNMTLKEVIKEELQLVSMN